jgi:hypothetical protein
MKIGCKIYLPTELFYFNSRSHTVFSIKSHDELLLFETLFCMWECFNMGTELPTEVMLGQTLVLMQMTFLKVGRLVLPITSCLISVICLKGFQTMPTFETFHGERMHPRTL